MYVNTVFHCNSFNLPGNSHFYLLKELGKVMSDFEEQWSKGTFPGWMVSKQHTVSQNYYRSRIEH